MSLNWSNVKSLAIPVGGVSRDVKRVSIGGVTVWEKPSPLPYDSEVEYLESTGTQWIDTGVIPDIVDMSIEISLIVSSAGHLFGSRVDSAFSAQSHLWSSYGSNQRDFRRDWIGESAYIQLSTTTPNAVELRSSQSGSSITYNGDTWTGDVKVPNSLSMYLFAVNNNGVAATGKLKIYHCKIIKNGVLVRDYIPVRRGTVGYLYDRVSGALFGNAGTGAFGYGQDVVPMTWQDGLQYNNLGTPIESAASSIGLDYIPITAGHSFTWRLGYGSSDSADLIIYNANKGRIDYWVARDRTVTISGAAAYMRISALTSYKEQATVYDETAQKYVFANGMIPTGGAS